MLQNFSDVLLVGIYNFICCLTLGIIQISFFFSCRFNRIFGSRSFDHLRVMYEEYESMSKSSIELAIKKELSGDLENAYLAIGILALSFLLFLFKIP